MQTLHLAILVSLIAMPTVAIGQSDDQLMPNTMLAFFKPGMHVGVRSFEGTADVALSVYDEEEYSIARVLRDRRRGSMRVSAVEFAKEYPLVRERLDAYLEKRAQVDPDATLDDVRVMPMSRTYLGIIRHVGDDFVLIDVGSEPLQRRILPVTKIGQIDLDGQAFFFLMTGEVR